MTQQTKANGYHKSAILKRNCKTDISGLTHLKWLSNHLISNLLFISNNLFSICLVFLRSLPQVPMRILRISLSSAVFLLQQYYWQINTAFGAQYWKRPPVVFSKERHNNKAKSGIGCRRQFISTQFSFSRCHLRKGVSEKSNAPATPSTIAERHLCLLRMLQMENLDISVQPIILCVSMFTAAQIIISNCSSTTETQFN